MTNSEQFYQAALRFQNERKEATDTYEKRMHELEAHRGSAYYNAEAKAAKDELADKLESLKGSARRQLAPVVEAMVKANNSRGMTAPTTEQLNVLAALKMRTNLTRVELDKAANSMDGNALALSVLNDLARTNGIAASYTSMSKEPADASEALSSMSAKVNDFIDYDTTRAARIAAKHNADHYGTAPAALGKRALFNDKDGCFREVCGVGSDYEAFYSVVDGNAENGGVQA